MHSSPSTPPDADERRAGACASRLLRSFRHVKRKASRESTVTAEGKTILPADVRSALGLESGDQVRYLILGGEVRLVVPLPADADDGDAG